MKNKGYFRRKRSRESAICGKSKRILSCILALILLLSLIDGQQFFVRAESEVKVTQTEQASNKMEETKTSSRRKKGRKQTIRRMANKKKEHKRKNYLQRQQKKQRKRKMKMERWTNQTT